MPESTIDVRVRRIGAGTYEVGWEPGSAAGPVCIYVGDSPQTIDRRRPAARSENGNHARLPGLPGGRRPYFEVVSSRGVGVIAAARTVALEGPVNFRDLGGYPVGGERSVRWGRLFRSDSLASLSAADLRRLAGMGKWVVLDFRSEDESRGAPDRLPADGTWDYRHLPVTMGAIDAEAAFKRLRRGDVSWFDEDFMTDGYIGNLDRYPRAWGKALERAARADGRPLVFHCSAGKDRTGTFAALLLLTLGVGEETVVDDYLLSNRLIAPRMEGFRKRIRSFGVDPDVLTPYLTAPRRCIHTLLYHLRERYGSAEAYFRGPCAVKPSTLDRLRRTLLTGQAN